MADSNGEGFVPKINQFAQDYIDELKKEQAKLPEEFPLCNEIIDEAIERIYAIGRTPGKELKADVFGQKSIKLSQNVYLPTKEYPKFNFQGKILGPKGNTLKRLKQETLCGIAIKGRNSMRDQEREEKLRQSGDPVYNHLNKNPYIEISTFAPPAEAYARIAYALNEIRKYIIPDKNDEISQEQYRELLEIDPDSAKRNFSNNRSQKSVFHKLASIVPSKRVSDEEEDESPKKKPQIDANKNEGQTKDNRLKRIEETSPADKIKKFRSNPYLRKAQLKAKASE